MHHISSDPDGDDRPNDRAAIVDSMNHRRAELEALRIAESALAKLTAARDYHDQEIARTALEAIRKKLETQ